MVPQLYLCYKTTQYLKFVMAIGLKNISTQKSINQRRVVSAAVGCFTADIKNLPPWPAVITK